MDDGSSSQFLTGYGPGYCISWYRDLQHKRKEWLVRGEHSTAEVVEPKDAVTAFQYVKLCSDQARKKQGMAERNTTGRHTTTVKNMSRATAPGPLEKLNSTAKAAEERPIWELWSTDTGLWTWGDDWSDYSVLQRGLFGENVVTYAFLLGQFDRAMKLLDFLRDTQLELKEKQQHLKEEQRELNEEQRELNEEQQELKEKQQELREEQQELKEEQQELKEEQQELKEKQQELKEEQQELKEERPKLHGNPYPSVLFLPYQLRDPKAQGGGSQDATDRTNALNQRSFSFYEGETLLHIAVVNGKHGIVKELLENHVKVAIDEGLMTDQQKYDFIHCRAIGAFFDKTTNPGCYYGEYALSFAVSQTVMQWKDQRNLIDLLIEHGADINMRDSHGNTALHMTVYHRKPEAYRYLCSEYKSKLNQSSRNRKGYSPLVLAARLGFEDMFYVALREQSELSWTFDYIASYQIPLRELDTMEAAIAHDKHLREGGEEAEDDPLLEDKGGEGGVDEDKDKDKDKVLKRAWLEKMDGTIPEEAPPGESALAVIVHHRYGFLLQEGILNEILNFKWQRYVVWDFGITCALYLTLVSLATLLACTKGTSDSVVWMEHTCFALTLFFWLLQLWDWYSIGFKHYRVNIKQRAPGRFPPAVPFPAEFKYFTLEDKPAGGAGPSSLRAKYIEDYNSAMPKSTHLRALSLWWQVDFMPRWETLTQRFTLTVVYMLAHLLFLGCMTVHWGMWMANPGGFEDGTIADGFLASGLVFGWFYTWFFARSSRELGPFVVMLVNMLLGDIVKRFALIYGSILISYAAALNLLYRSDNPDGRGESEPCPFCTFGSSILTLFRTMVGDVAYDEYCPPEEDSCLLVTFLFVGFTLMSNLVLLNLLIALMNTTYTTTMSDAQDQAMLQKAEIIIATEARWKPVWMFFSKWKRGRRPRQPKLGSVAPDTGTRKQQYEMDPNHRPLQMFRFGDPSSNPKITTFFAHVNMYSHSYLRKMRPFEFPNQGADGEAAADGRALPLGRSPSMTSATGNHHGDSAMLRIIMALLNNTRRRAR
eukprot:jgi/Tetstr1/426984/TSEL_001706.t1